MNGDYEDALLRLLAGEGEFLVIESDPALRALRDELEAQNPNTGLYREFAAVDVHLNPTKLEGNGSAAPDPGAQPEPEVSVDELAPASDAEEGTAGEASQAAEPEGEGAEPSAPHTPDTCPWCRGALPQRANLNYCPFCGTDVHVVPCPSCGEELEPEWRFCIACGAETGS
ncbi:MAG: zinc ribbon domain-containing protein [Gemmatimonadota bacterium]